VANVAPTVNLTGDLNVDEGSTHTYSFTVTDPGVDGFTVDAAYPDCDAGATNNGSYVAGSLAVTAAGGSFKCSFPDGPSTANVKIKVADSDGASTTDSESVQVVAVANVAPTVVAAAGQSSDEGQAKSFSLGSFSDPGVNDSWMVDVSWGDSSTTPSFSSPQGTIAAKTHTYADNGSYTVTVKVTDNTGDSDSKTFTVTVANVAPKPKALTFEQAAALPLAGLTAYRAVVTRANVQAGEKVLVTGIGGGVATFALQIAASRGAQVFVGMDAVGREDDARDNGAKGRLRLAEAEGFAA